MPPKPKHSKEEIIDTALDIIRTDGIEAITAQEIANRLGTSTRPMFTYFATVEELRSAAYVRAMELYESYAHRGLAMNPPYKGYAMEYVRFAAEEPNLYRLLFMQPEDSESFRKYTTHTWNRHLFEVRKVIRDNFGLTEEQSDWLHETLGFHSYGLASMCACGIIDFDEQRISEQFGAIFRALVIYLNAPKDERTRIIPAKDAVIPGGMTDYFRLQSDKG